MAAAGERKYTYNTASETLEWINAIIDFIKPYRFFLDAHVVNFFKDRLWEAVDKEWMDCLRNEPVENLVLIPSGVVQDRWPNTLKNFIRTLRHLSLHREQTDLEKDFPGFDIFELNKVLAQGMNPKKKHEIQALAGIVNTVAKRVGSNTIVDVGAGQGYLSQVLSFQFQHSVYAIDACLHHGRVTDARAERIRKYYAAKIRKSCSEERDLRMPKTVTCRVLSAAKLKDLSNSILEKDHIDSRNQVRESISKQTQSGTVDTGSCSPAYANCNSPLVLAGLHACGDLSVTMLRTFLDCQEVKAVVSIGCCYNLLSEDKEDTEDSDLHCAFPLSSGLKSSGFRLGKSARDLACQSADRWRSLGEEAGLNNFELHAFRAAFQMVLFRYYPEQLTSSPAIGRQGKALRRQQQWRILQSSLHSEEHADSSAPVSGRKFEREESWSDIDYDGRGHGGEKGLEEDPVTHKYTKSDGDKPSLDDRFSLFVGFTQSGLCRLGLSPLQDADLYKIWEETQPFSEMIGPYWSLRAALGPALETILLLDRMLFLQEQGNALEVRMLPIFDPVLSPRNVAIIAQKM